MDSGMAPGTHSVAEEPPAIPLIHLKAGTHCVVVRVLARHRSRREKLATYAIVPGSHLRLLRKRPAYVIQVGETELALDSEVASDILVRVVRPHHRARHPEQRGATVDRAE